MMITIHGLPPKTTFQTVKTLMKQECNIIDFILDNLVDDGPNAKKVRIGLSDDSEGYRIMKYLNGFRMSPTHLLKIVPVGKPLNHPPEESYNQRPTYSNDYPSQSQPHSTYQSPMDSYGNRPHSDARKPQIINKNMERKQNIANSGLLQTPEQRPPNSEYRAGPHGLSSHGPHGSSLHGPPGSSSHGPHGSSSHGPHGASSHGPHAQSGTLSSMHVPDSHGPYGSVPHGPGAQFSGTHGPSPHMSAPDMRGSSQWTQDANSGRMGEIDWGQPSQGMQGSSGYGQRLSQGGFRQQQPQGGADPYSASQGRPPPTQGYGFQPTLGQERMAPAQHPAPRQHVLRPVDIVATPPSRQYQPTQEKPITIMKDNFQGPHYSGASQQSNYSGQPSGPVWQMEQHPGGQYEDRRPLPAKRLDPPKQLVEPKRGQFIPIGSSRPISPSNRNYQESNRQYPERRPSPNRLGTSTRGFSPSGRRSPGRKLSPERRFSPRRKMSPSHRRVSPGRRYSPGSKKSPVRFSPRRKMSPGRFPAGRKISPGRFSPGRKMSPGRFSPGRKITPEKYSPDSFSPGRTMSPEKSGEGQQMSTSGEKKSSLEGWNTELDHLKKKTRQLFNRASNTNKIEDWENFKQSQRMYKRETSKLKRRTLRAKNKEGGPENEENIGERSSGEPDERRMSGHFLPGRQSPTRRLVSPTRPRFSPNRLGDKSSDKFMEGPGSKPIRPAYEPQAQNQYTGGYRDSVQYARQEPRPSPWQNEKIVFPSSAKEERDLRRLDIPVEKSPRQSRSPMKDRYRRHSPSPRSRSSRSPRRSWALEKRSPEAIREPPPPPVWPGQDPDPPRKPPRFNSPTQEPKHGSVWERLDEQRQYQEKPHARRDMDESRPFQVKLRMRNDLQDSTQNFPRREFDDRRDFREEERKQTDRDREYRRDDRPEYKRESPRRDVRDVNKVFTDIDKDFHDIYERAVQLRKKTEERQRSVGEHKADGRQEGDASPQRRSRSRERKDWNMKGRKRLFLSPTVKAKRDKASDEIVAKMFSQYDLTDDQKHRIREELKMALSSIFIEMFADKDVSFIELVIKYQAKYPPKEEEKLLKEVLSTLPTQYRTLKRKADAGDTSEISTKTSRRSPERNTLEENKPRPKLSDATVPEWQIKIEPPKVMSMSLSVAPKVNLAAPGMVPSPVTSYVPNPVAMATNVFNQQQMQFGMMQIQQQTQQTQISTNQIQQTQIRVNQMQQMQLAANQIQQNQISANQIQLPTISSNQMLTPQGSAIQIQQPVLGAIQTQQSQLAANEMQQWQFNALNQVQQPYFSANQLQQLLPNQQIHVNNPQQFVGTQEPNKDDPVGATQQSNESYNLYLVQDDFEPFSSNQAENLRKFILKEIIKQTESSNGWAPDLILKGLQSAHRYEISTNDEQSKDWIVNLDFSEFEFFHVLVYTKEELWYERAAIWLPGHTRCRILEPLEKLKLQNKFLEDINLRKWKFVKKIVTLKGTRLYVDMPPSAARALENYKMMLSYDYQKVSVFLKAVAVDKDVFDDGLKEASITDAGQLATALQSSPMPTLNVNSDPGIIKIGLNGQKVLTIELARKIKETLTYHLTKYLQSQGNMRTDFVKYGYCPPNCIGVVPENDESKKWLLSRYLGKMNRATIVVYGDETDNKMYFRMSSIIPYEYNLVSTSVAFERIKLSNQGIKGIHFNFWKPISLKTVRQKTTFEVDMDLESVETLSKMKYKLDYVAHTGTKTVVFRSEYSYAKLEEKIKRHKMEQVDSYVVANMELASDSDHEDDDNETK